MSEKWPGKYPDSDGWWHYEGLQGEECVYVYNENTYMYFIGVFFDRPRMVQNTNPGEWGPKIDLIEKWKNGEEK